MENKLKYFWFRLETPDPNDMESVSQTGSPVKSEQSCSPIPVQSPRVHSSPAPANKDSLNGSDFEETLGAIPKIRSPVNRTAYCTEEHSYSVTRKRENSSNAGSRILFVEISLDCLIFVKWYSVNIETRFNFTMLLSRKDSLGYTNTRKKIIDLPIGYVQRGQNFEFQWFDLPFCRMAVLESMLIPSTRWTWNTCSRNWHIWSCGWMKLPKLSRPKESQYHHYLYFLTAFSSLGLEWSFLLLRLVLFREKGSLHRSTESLQLELLELRSRVEELKCAKQEAERQLLISQEQYRQQVICLQQEQRDEANTRETLDRRLADLRSEVSTSFDY